ncbi:Clp protease ClpP [Hoeflea sp. YIM 152468]|uniref:head maturation protease, ClpP-related n=1 Tax=Hoeflea sp. YIM 152468 TaxID=3031759 RepID=UPI0023DB3789|nr:head maturation protease, ClpP-related [Hoeflea sp. YIM 152468]MDF1606962.1 Clp protease ClpP [Hoeflea sp. YIM 152468]
MSLRNLPEIQAFQRPKAYQWDVPSDALARWVETPCAAANDDPATITIYDVIGEDTWYGGGFTVKRMNAALRAIGPKDVTVRINSPGGDVFEGFAIYNELRSHKAKVSVEVMGIAASAASYIAMAGDDIKMGLGSFIMIHNSWGVVMGNRNDLVAASEMLAQIDGAQMDIYEVRTGLKRTQIEEYMDAETFFSAKSAMEKGFADDLMENETGGGASASVRPEIQAKRRMDAILAQSGVPRSERRRMIKEAIGDTQNAIPPVTHDADLDPAALLRLIATMRS